MAIEAKLADGRVLRFPDGTDPTVIDTTVQNLLAESQPAPAPKPASPAPVVAKEPEPPKRAPYKNRLEMLDDAVNLLEEGANQEKLKQSLQSMGVKFEDVIKHGQQRGSNYFKQQAPLPPETFRQGKENVAYTGTVKAIPETKFTESPGKYAAEATGNMFKRVDASLGDIATSYLFQAGVADADAAGRLLTRNAKQRAAAAPSQDIRAGMEEIGNSKTYGEAISALASNPRATFTMLVESVAVSLPGMVPALVLGPAGVVARSTAAGLSSGGIEYGSVMADVLQDKGVNMLDANAISKALSNPKIIAEMRDKAAKRGLIIGVIDGLSLGVAGRFLKPAQALIAEGKLAGAAAKKATMAAWGKELATQTAGGAGGEFAAQKATGDDKPADVLLEALAGVVTAPLEARSNLRNARMAEQEAAINAELTAQKEPANMDLGELGAVRPSDDLKEPPPTPSSKTTPDAVRETRVQEEYERLIALGTPLDTARNMAARRVADAIKAENKAAAIKIPENRVEQLTQDLIAVGVDPQQAVIDAQRLALEEAQADELAQNETGGTANVVEPISTPSGESVEVAGQPSAEPPAGGVTEVEPSGVVSAGQDVAGVTVGETTQQAPLEEKSISFEIRSANNQEQSITSGAVATLPLPGGAKAIFTQNGDGDIELVAPNGKADKVVRAHDPREGAVRSLEDFPDYVPEPLRQLMLYYQRAARENYYAEGDSKEATQQRLNEVQDEIINTAKSLQTEGADLGTETSQAIETTQEGQETPPAGAVKGKTGPKPKPVEVKEQIKVSRNEQNRINNDAEYNRKKFVAQLDQTLTPEQIEELSFEEAEQAEIDARQSRRSALRGLIELQDNPNIARGSAVGKRISAAIKNSKATEAELADIRRGIKAAQDVLTGPKEDVLGSVAAPGVSGKTEARTNKSADARVDKPDAGFNNLTTGPQAIAQVIKTGTLFQRFVAQRIRNFMVDVKFVVVEKGDGTPADILAQLEGARGLFVYTPGQKDRTIYVRGSSFGDQQGINNITVLHELLHAATSSRINAGLLKGFKNASLQKFIREMNGVMQRTEAAYRLGTERGTIPSELQDLVEVGNIEFDKNGDPKFEIFTDLNEFLAYGMSSPEFQKFLMRVKGERKESTLFFAFTNNIRDLFGIKQGEATAFSDLIDITDKMLDTRLTKVDTKGGVLQQKINYTPPEFDEDADKGEQKELRTAKELNKARVKAEITYQQSADSQKVKNAGMLQKLRDPEKAKILFKGAWKKMNRGQRELAVRLPTWDFLADWLKADLPQVQQALDLHNDMKGMTKALLEAAEERIRVTRNAFKADKTLEEKLTQMIYKTTDAQYDPSDTTQKVRDKVFDNGYKALGAKGQELYKMWRDYYVDMGDLFIELLDEQVRGISGLTDEVKSNLAAVIRQTYETKDRIKPFFPFVRDEGDFWLAVGKSTSPTRAFYIYESATERDEDVARIAREKRQSVEEMRDSGEMELGDDLAALRNTAKDSSQLLTSIFRAIDAIKLPAGDTEGTTNAYKENLKDSVYQVFLNTMPEQSFRLMFRHRKGRGGYRTDLIQNVAKTAAKMSVQLARLKYAQKMRNVTSAARDSIVGRDYLLIYVKELERRVATVLSPKPQDVWDAIAGVANRVTYLWTLTSASTALIQPMSIYVSALPILAVNHGFSPIRTAKELGKMITYLNQYGIVKENVDGTHRYVAPSIANAKNLPADEKRAIQAMTRMNVAQSTYVAQVYDYSQTPVSDLESVRGRGKEAAYLITGALMHNMERLTREVVYLASYRLGKQRGLSEVDAIKQAADDTREALGDYETTNKPRWMQRGVGRVAFAMKMYPVVMIQQLFGNFLKMLPFFNKEGKKEALAKFIGIYMTAGSIAGLAGIPAYSMLIHAIVAALKDEVDDEDLPEELKNMDPEMWLREVYMPQKFGEYSVGGVPLDEWIMDGPINAITGLSVSSRIGLNDIWAKDGKSTKDVKEAAAGFLAAYFGGPTLSVATSMLNAVEQYMLGDYEKGNEKMMPKPIRDFLLAQKYDVEGIKSATGVELVAPENVKTSEKVGQMIGFAPALTASVKEAGFKMLSKEQDIVNERSKILRKLDIQNRKGTDEGDAKFEKIMDKEVEDFNKRYPDYTLKIADVKKSLKTKEDQRQRSPAGVTTTKKFYGVGDEAISNLEKKLERREKEMEERRKIELTNMGSNR